MSEPEVLYYEIQGEFELSTGGTGWMPLYQYRSKSMANAIRNHLIDLDVWPRELDIIEDLRVVEVTAPKRRLTPEERAARRERRERRERAAKRRTEAANPTTKPKRKRGPTL